MKRFTHVSAMLALGVCFAPTPGAVLCGLVGSVAPDRIDFARAGHSAEKFQKIHRGISHHFFYIFVIFALIRFGGLFFFPKYTMIWASVEIEWLFIGMFVHVLLDMLTPSGIPVFPWSFDKASLRLIRTGSQSDFLLGLSLLAMGAIGLFFVPQTKFHVFMLPLLSRLNLF